MQVQLKGRFKVQRLLVRIADAHGRLVRTIRLHYHSKPVASITDLRMPENAAKWRLAATVHVRVFLCVFACYGCLPEYNGSYCSKPGRC